jgi:hypothetical protein
MFLQNEARTWCRTKKALAAGASAECLFTAAPEWVTAGTWWKRDEFCGVLERGRYDAEHEQ